MGDATDTPGFDSYYGWGRLNAYHSLLLAQTRIDRVERTNDALRLSWISPANASQKHPYQVEFKNALHEPWTPVPAIGSGFEYTSQRTSWSDTNAASQARFYRVRVRPLP